MNQLGQNSYTSFNTEASPYSFKLNADLGFGYSYPSFRFDQQIAQNPATRNFNSLALQPDKNGLNAKVLQDLGSSYSFGNLAAQNVVKNKAMVDNLKASVETQSYSEQLSTQLGKPLGSSDFSDDLINNFGKGTLGGSSSGNQTTEDIYKSFLNDYKSDVPKSSKGLTKTQINKGAGYISMAADLAGAGIEAGTDDYNKQYGSQSESAVMIKDTVGSSIPVFGAVNSVAGLAQKGMNLGNDFDEDGVNANPGYGKFYFSAGHAFDPAGSAMRTMEVGGEGSGFRAILSLMQAPGAGQLQANYEQKEAKNRAENRRKMEQSEWSLNQFNFSPKIDV